MSKKHFEHAAMRIRGLRETARRAALLGQAGESSRIMSEADGAEAIVITLGMEFNPRFDINRFHAACALLP